MRKLLLSLVLSFISICCFSQVEFKIEEKYELTSIVARLAGYQEYTQCPIASYNKSIDDYFKPYLEHEIIRFMKEVREKDAIAYDAIASSAALLEIKDGKVAFKENVDLKEYLEAEKRWKNKSLRKYVKLLDDFYKDSEFDKFFAENKPIYDDILNGYNILTEIIDCYWIEEFTGKELESPEFFLSVTNGPSNYALHGTGNGDYGTLNGTMDPRFVNMAYLYSGSLPYILHELSHPITADLLSPYADDIRTCGDKLWSIDYTREHAIKNAYGSGTAVVYEYINDLFVLIYLMEHQLVSPEDDVHKTLDYRMYSLEEDYGYLGIRDCLAYYKRFYSKEKYGNIYGFFPELFGYFKEKCSDPDKLYADFMDLHPKVTGVSVDSTNARYDLVKVKFSKKMLTGISGMSGIEKENIQQLDKYLAYGVGGVTWLDDYTYAVFVKKMEPGKYGAILTAKSFVATNGFSMMDNFELIIEK